MQFMVSFRLNVDGPQTPPPDELREAEFEAIRKLYMDGDIRQIWLKGEGSGAFAIMEAATTEDVAQLANDLPMVRAGVLREPEVIPLSPYWGFAPRLIGK